MVDRAGAAPAGRPPTVVAVSTYRAIATDLDGTLLGSDGRVSARTRAAVLAAEDRGMDVVIATGRPPRWIAPIVEQLGDRGLVVCANGAAVYDPARHELVRRTELSPETLGSVVDDLQDAFPEAVLGLEQGFDFAIDEAVRDLDVRARDGWNLEGLRIGPIQEFLGEPALKLIVRLPPPATPGTAEAVQSVIGDRGLVTHSVDEAFLEVSHPLVHKAVAVEALLVERGTEAAEVVAFGDMPNDLELIRWAGLGVAVANAHPLLRDAADEVTASNDDDGVAMVIERLLER
jgi:hydroxymethylpyrimidine pyrophosphatase-like HAD family hydrolase